MFIQCSLTRLYIQLITTAPLRLQGPLVEDNVEVIQEEKKKEAKCGAWLGIRTVTEFSKTTNHEDGPGCWIMKALNCKQCWISRQEFDNCSSFHPTIPAFIMICQIVF
ncbi:hypothetical protein Fcan01_09781 [Folsomia candida]|uniref:Uncharacterized protein n=1 Tax=Folsomia candida TaxID=158441 RepID=A0A226EG34_FOLCA|nr:hypothetical protein Fcan01_09781 [Folsomia candida]